MALLTSILGTSFGTREKRLIFNTGSTTTWTNMPAALSLFGGTASFIQETDLVGYTQARLRINKLGTAAIAGAEIRAMYSTTYTQTAGSYVQLGSSAQVSVTIGTTINSFFDTGWVNMASGAAVADVYIAILGLNGDGVVDPNFGAITVDFQ